LSEEEELRGEKFMRGFAAADQFAGVAIDKDLGRAGTDGAPGVIGQVE
jgi:hypothetical protein